MTTCATATGRVLNNPSTGVELHFEFMYQVLAKFKEVREGENKEQLNILKNIVKLFFIGPPGPNGEPLQGPNKDLYLAFVKVKVNYRETFGTSVELGEFK